eukprot:594259-Prymnesium_polylepis.1
MAPDATVLVARPGRAAASEQLSAPFFRRRRRPLCRRTGAVCRHVGGAPPRTLALGYPRTKKESLKYYNLKFSSPS